MKPTTNIEQERRWLLCEKYGGVESDAFRADLERIEKEEPVAYVIGFSKFIGTHIDLSERPLIPRPETEYWVEKAIGEITQKYGTQAQVSFLDIFSGSGCIGIALLSRFPNATVDFADIDPDAIRQIKKNLRLNDIDSSRYAVYQSDIFKGIPSKKYDAIFANPPYIVDRARVDSSVLNNEPHRALFAQSNGLEFIYALLANVRQFLCERGILYIEHDDFHAGEIERELADKGFQHQSHKDQFGLSRWVSVR